MARPIADRDEALRMAVLQHAYCNDIVDQGTRTIEAVAASLLGATSGYVWWD